MYRIEVMIRTHKKGFLGEGRMEKICKTCKWHDAWSAVCFNGYSYYVADYTDDDNTCDHWEGRVDAEQTDRETC